MTGTAPPDAFGPFRVLHQIGAGALGPVFRAYQPEQDRLVAVKLFRLDIPPERTHQLVSQLERLIAADLTHAGIAAPLATGLSEVSAYLAMDFVAADSLDIVVRDQQVSAPADVVRVAAQLAKALDLAAAIDITHGALHPRDVLLSADDVRMTGIGIARALEAVGVSAPVRRPYTAPERADGLVWDRRADVFSLAALIFELLTRRRISGPGDQPSDAFAGVIAGSASALGDVFDRALAERASDRFPTAGDFAVALQSAIERKRASAGRVATSIRTPAPAPVVEPEPSAPLPVEELPLFTDSMLGVETPPAADALPPPIVDVEHETLAPAAPFSEAALSMVDSMHEPELAGGHRHLADDFTAAPSASHRRHMTIDDFNPAAQVPDSPAENAGEAGFAADVHDAPVSRPAPFETVDAGGSRLSSGVWPLMLSLVLGIALGFGIAMLLLGPDRMSLAPQSASAVDPARRTTTEIRDEPVREVTEQTIASPPKAPAQQAPPPVNSPAATAPAPVPVPSPAAAPAVAARPSVEKPSAAPPPTARRADAPAANRTASRPPNSAAANAVKATPAPKAAAPKKPATSAPRADASRTAAPAPRSARPAGSKPVPAVTPKPAPRASDQAEPGSLVVDSRPAGAIVYLDGRRMGTTPLVLSTLKIGQHTIGIDLTGYQRWATTVQIESGERSRVAASLER